MPQPLTALRSKLIVRSQPAHEGLDQPGAVEAVLVDHQALASGTVRKYAYLGSCQEVTLDTALGSIFAVSPELERPWQPGQTAWLSLAGHGQSVVSA